MPTRPLTTADARRPHRPEPGRPTVVIVMPAYNAARTLERTYADIPHDIVDRIILVDDVSRDETVDVARQLGLDVIIHQQNLGYGGNQKTCYDAALEAGADVVVMLHPDYQYDATRIPALIAPILAGERDLMLGSRFLGDPLAGGMPQLEVRQQPLPDDRREPARSGSTCPSTTRACGPTAGASSRRSRTASTATTSSSTRSSSPRSSRPAWRGRIGEIARPDALLRGGELGRLQAQRRLRPLDAPRRRCATSSTGCGSAGRPSSRPAGPRPERAPR